MRNFIRPILVASPLVLAIPAFAASIQYDDTITNANGQNVTAPQNVSTSKPLPTTTVCTSGCNGTNASVGTNGAAIPGFSTLIGTKDGSGNTQPASSANPVPISNAYGYQLLSNVSATGNGSTFGNVAGGSYILDIRGTLGGASVAVQVSGADGTLTTLATQTTTGTFGTYQIGASSSVRAVLTGGTPSGVYVALQGVGSSLNVTSTNAIPNSYVAAASTNATNVKTSTAVLSHLSGFNPAATPSWVTTYDTASTPTCGTGIKHRQLLPANSTNGSGAVEDFANGETYVNGFGFCITLNPDGTGAVAAGAGVVNADVK